MLRTADPLDEIKSCALLYCCVCVLGLAALFRSMKALGMQHSISWPEQQQTYKRRVDSHGRTTRIQSRCRTAAAQIESIQGIRTEVEKAIAAAANHCVIETKLPLPNKRVGKVRDTYELEDKLVIVTTDRQSAFDRLLASIPFKGQVLNQTSAWWFNSTKHIIPNAVLAVPDPNITIMKRCTVFPVEFVVRGFITGSTDTSLWTHYKNGAREYCGNKFPDGMKKNQRLAANVITPTTKSEEHDEPISPAEIVSRGLMSQENWDAVGQAVLALFKYGQEQAASRGLLLVDTKYELGKDREGNILLLDEVTCSLYVSYAQAIASLPLATRSVGTG
eukprot:GHRR01005277.1.p1 GENE.GHRR01005277.1~~GHRR01005277.1.p1  ORF type:complete len:333 (+),score=55.36 GHRR01005277.1:3-1001(+)